MKLYHNPRCSKSRNALALLTEKGVEFDTILYLNEAPSLDDIQEIVTKLNVSAKDIIRFGDKTAKELGINKTDQKSEDEWTLILCNNPSLLERPILIHKDTAAIGRPLEHIEAIL